MSEQGYAIEHCIADVKETLAAKGVTQEGLEGVGKHLQRLTSRDDLLGEVEHEMLHGQVTFRRLHKESDGLTLILARFSAEEATPIHNHGTWGVLCPYRGRDRYEGWRRADDGSKPGFALVEKVFERILEPGDIVYWFDPPNDIHRQQGMGEAAWELILVGKDFSTLPRLYFDPERNTVQEMAATH